MIISYIGALQQVYYNISMWQNRCSLKDFVILQNVKTTTLPFICEKCEKQQIYISIWKDMNNDTRSAVLKLM